MIKCRRDLNAQRLALKRIKQIGLAVVFAVAEELAFQLECAQKLIADGFLLNFPYFPLFHPLSFSQVALARKQIFLDDKERDFPVAAE